MQRKYRRKKTIYIHNVQGDNFYRNVSHLNEGLIATLVDKKSTRMDSGTD
jgi:hypothetical protein